MKNNNLYQKINKHLSVYQGRLFDREVKIYGDRLKFLFNSYTSFTSRIIIGDENLSNFEKDVYEIERIEIFILFINCFSKKIYKTGGKLKLRVFLDERSFIDEMLKTFNEDLSCIDVDNLRKKFSFVKFHPCIKFLNFFNSNFEDLLNFISNSNLKKEEKNFQKGLVVASESIHQSLIENLAVHERVLLVPLDVLANSEEFELSSFKKDVQIFVQRIKFDRKFKGGLTSSFIKIYNRSLFVADTLVPVARLGLAFSLKNTSPKDLYLELNNFCLIYETTTLSFESRTKKTSNSSFYFGSCVISPLKFDLLKDWSEVFLLDRNLHSCTDKKFFSFL